MMTDTNSDKVVSTMNVSSKPLDSSIISNNSIHNDTLDHSLNNTVIEKHPLNASLYGNHGFHICHFNIRSLLPKIHEIKKLLCNKNIHVITLSETWLSSNIDTKELLIEGYNFFRQDRSYKINNKKKKSKRSGGVGIYVREDILVDQNSMKHLNKNTVNLEALWIVCKFTKMRNFIIGNFYRPPQGNKTSFINYVLDISDELKNNKKAEKFILGDVNICLKNDNNISRNLVESMKICGFRQVIKVSTRLGKTCSLLDHIYTDSTNILDHGVGDLNISDHLLVWITRKKEKEDNTKNKFKGRIINIEQIDMFKNVVKNENWNDLSNLNDPNVIWEKIENRLNKCADVYFPVKIKKGENLRINGSQKNYKN